MQVLLKFFTPLGLPDIEEEEDDMDGKNEDIDSFIFI